MKTTEIIKRIHDELDSRKLKKPNIRKNALDKVIGYMEKSGTYLKKDTVLLPSEKDTFKYYMALIKGNELNGAESSIINMMYTICDDILIEEPESTSECNETILSEADDLTDHHVINDNLYSSFAEKLTNGCFKTYKELNNGEVVPDKSGIYCIKLVEKEPEIQELGEIKEDGIIYIGIASKSLRKRLWEEELNHKRAATFFRSVGAALGFLPPKGSLKEKANKKNYEFSDSDTEKIISWIKSKLKVNFIEFPAAELHKMEKKLIQQYRPLMNILSNPAPSEKLKGARKRCVEWANS